MFKKIQSLNNIVSLGLNVHRFYIPESYDDCCRILNDWQFCTVRTDHEVFTEDLPFYLVDMRECDVTHVDNIWITAQKKGYKLIISDGIKYDVIQLYNMTVKFERNGDFSFEASELKIPLRHMYRYPLLSCSGNIAADVSEWIVYNARFGLDRRLLKRDLELLYTYQFYGKWLEVTRYPQGVGIKDEPFVFWQIH